MANNFKHRTFWSAALALALCVVPTGVSAQNQSARSDSNVEPLPGYPVGSAGYPQQENQPPAPDTNSPEATAPDPRTSSPQEAPPPPGAARQTQSAPPFARPGQPAGPVPAQLTLPGNTIIPVRLTGWLSSEQNHPGDTFSAALDQPLVVNGWVVARRGQTVIGRVTTVKKAGHFGSVSELGLELSMVTLIDGQQVSVKSTLVQNNGRSTAGTDAATLGVTTGLGAAVGAAADGGYGAGLGAGIGAVVGLAGVMTSHGSPTVVRPETLLSFELGPAVVIDTAQSQAAFQPVRPSDFRADQDAYARGYRPSLRGQDDGDEGYPPPPPPVAYPYPYYPYYPSYPSYGWGYYPGPVIGLGFGFGGYGYGRYGGYYGGRGFGGRGFRR